MIKLTEPDGHWIWILKAWVQMVRSPVPSEYPGIHTRAVVVLSGINQAVREEVHEVVALLREETVSAV